MVICELVYVEEGRQYFPSSVLHYPVPQHEKQFEKIQWLASCVLDEAYASVYIPQLVAVVY